MAFGFEAAGGAHSAQVQVASMAMMMTNHFRNASYFEGRCMVYPDCGVVFSSDVCTVQCLAYFSTP